jgi:putative two-component system response regulator
MAVNSNKSEIKKSKFHPKDVKILDYLSIYNLRSANASEKTAMFTDFKTISNGLEFLAMPTPTDAWPALADFRQSLLQRSSQPPAALVVAERDSERRMLVSLLRREGCRIIEASNGPTGLDLVAASPLDLVVLDRDMASLDGLECCRRIKSNRRTALTPVLMVTAIRSVSDEVAGIQAGADEYLSKPIHPEVFRARIRALIRHKVAVDRLEETETILFALAQAVEKRDHSTAGHCQRLAMYSVAFGLRLGLSQSQLLALHRGGYLHDIGKIAIPDSILFKAGKLSSEEWVLMKTHSIRGEEICRPLRSLSDVLPIIRNHHERWDGAGYPDGLRGQGIPLLARVLQLADAYDALTTERPYKPAFPSQTAIEMLEEESRLGWRDPELTATFVKLPFAELASAAERMLVAEGADDFEKNLRNLQEHLLALAS